ncbi:transcription termination/antitermination protein NusG [Bradyrhizobium sp. STM 3557]|uniref:transcription termination/antitermination protein NusG n=1 Tax=Bradyrhizobium sp. STM 3557 TaxID=578920 RepID=UPI00388FCE9F
MFVTSPSRRERWYAVYTLPNREAGAQLNLRNQGFRTFLPLLPKTVRHARRHETILAPLFPRYMFVALDPTRDRWRAINGTHGVTTLIMYDERPAPVQSGVVETLIASSTPAGEVLYCQDVALGDRVRLIAGPFAGQLGILQRLNTAGRVQVLLEIMGSQIPTNLHARSVVPAGQSRAASGAAVHP